MEHYILIAIMKYYESASAISQEFNTKVACYNAKLLVQESSAYKTYKYNYIICVPKGKENGQINTRSN